MNGTMRVPGWLAWAILLLALSLCAVAPRTASAQGATDAAATGVNFSGVSQPDTSVEAEFLPKRFNDFVPLVRKGNSPPDTIGSVGPRHIVEMTNGAYAMYDKSGTELDSGALSSFWKDAGLEDAQERPALYDPVVQYDPQSHRWFALTEDNSASTVVEDPSPSRILLAVSDSSDPTAGWKAYSWASNPPNTDPDERLWADQALLGFNKDGVYIASNMFYLGGDEFPPDYELVIVIPKEDLLRGVPSGQVDATRFDRIDLNATGYFMQPAIDPYSSGEPAVMLSDLANVGLPGKFKMTLITGDVRSPRLDTSIEPIDAHRYEAAPKGRQPNGAEAVDTGDGQLALAPSLVARNGSVWGVEHVENKGHAALHWFEIDTRTGTLRQEGLISDPNLDFFYGSIAFNEFGDVVLGFNGSGKEQFISSYAAVGQTHDGKTTFGSPILLKEGESTFEYRLVPGSERLRWGDYSNTVVDPQDSESFWTFQEFVAAKNSWGTQISQIKVTDRAGVENMPRTGGQPLAGPMLVLAIALLLSSGVAMLAALRLRM
ncbi:MAG: hypothetical protein H0U55_04245 [Rubrobacteraceae bacterium]|nr:hypothetical protein [Rubrobacteraceae bacterium]